MYSSILNQPVPQNQPLNERQVQNNAGGFAYEVSNWDQLDRFLILGTLGGTYYLNERALTKQNFAGLLACVKADGERVVRRIVEISKAGRAVKNDPAIFVLALVFKEGDEKARRAASDAVSDVCRTGTHILRFAAEVEGLKRGWGRALKRGVASWFTTKDADHLAYQAIKYAQREGWSLRDLLRLSKPKMGDNPVAAYITHGTGGHPLIDATLALRGLDAKDAAALIREHRLPREAVPTEMLNDPAIWEALLADMPLTAMIRNLGKMTAIGLIAPLSEAEKRVVAHLVDRERLRKARVHPLSLLTAMGVYQSGAGLKGSLRWNPSSAVAAALSNAMELAFASAPATGLKTLVGIDCSGSMHVPLPGCKSLRLHHATACMALCAINAEPFAETMGFETNRYRLDLKGRRLDDAINQLPEVGAGTDVAQPILWASEMRETVDLIQIYTDSETWAGSKHPEQALEEYRKSRNPHVKVAVVSMTANRITVGDPNDPNILQCVGFDASLPQVIAAFAGGKSDEEAEDLDAE